MPKLEAVKKEQDRMELLNKKLLEVKNKFYFKMLTIEIKNDEKIKVEQSKSNKLFVDAISAKLILDDDNDDQDILDQHVSRVWSDRTPHRSPGNLSPGNQFSQQFRRKPYEMQFTAGGSELNFFKFLEFI